MYIYIYIYIVFIAWFTEAQERLSGDECPLAGENTN